MNYSRTQQEVAGQLVFYKVEPVAFSALGIGNFKPFDRQQTVPIRPLTLLFGENSSGKSSVIQALLYGKNAFETAVVDAFETDPVAGGIDLGGYSQFIHRGDMRKDISLGYSFPTPQAPENDGTYIYGGSGSKRPTVFGEYSPKLISVEIKIGPGAPFFSPESPKTICVKEYVIKADGEAILIFRGWGGGETKSNVSKSMAFVKHNSTEGCTLRLEYANFEHPVIRTFIESDLKQILGRGIDTSKRIPLSGINEDLFIESVGQSLIPSRLVREWDASIAYSRLRFSPASFCKSPSGGTAESEELPEPETVVFCRFLDEIIRSVYLQASDVMNRMAYLGPLRLLPDRDVGFPQRIGSAWWGSGGIAWERLRDEPHLREDVNHWLSSKKFLASPYAIVAEEFVEQSKVITGAKSREIKGGGESDNFQKCGDAKSFHRLRLLDKRSNTMVTHRDVGIGISQVLPVLVAALGTRNHTHLIEQPEIHLHPRLQAELADVFIRSALGESKNTFILETHSEHLLLRIMRRMRETACGRLPKGIAPIGPKDVAVLYVERKGRRSIIREMPLNENGELLKAWPGGFFEEGLREML